MWLYQDRIEAGQLLADELMKCNLPKPICVFALPRGGVPLAAQIAKRFHAPLDLLCVKKIGASANEEFAVGAVSEDEVFWNPELPNFVREHEASQVTRTQEQLRAQLDRWRTGRTRVDPQGKTALVIDDGLATGSTMVAALRFLKRRNPRSITVAVPIASLTALRLIKPHCDQIVALITPVDFHSVSQGYLEFGQVSDEEVRELLSEAEKTNPPQGAGSSPVS